MAALSHSLIVFLIILGCAAAIGLGWGFYSLYNGRHDQSGQHDVALPTTEQSQAVYMREVRLRNQDVIAGMYGYKA